MKLGSVGLTLMGAGVLISVLGGLAFCAVNGWFHAKRKLAWEQPSGPMKRVLDSALACSIFGFFRFSVSVAAVVVLFLRSQVSLPSFVATVLFAASAGLYFLEVIPAGVCIDTALDTLMYSSTVEFSWDNENLKTKVENSQIFTHPNDKTSYFKDSQALSWYVNYDWRQKKYTDKYPDDETGTNNVIPFSKAEFLPLLLDLEGYAVPSAYYWGGYGFAQWSSPYVLFPCIIDYMNSTWPVLNYTTDRYGWRTWYYNDCDNFSLVVVDCTGGWNEGKLHSAVAGSCRRRNVTLANQAAERYALTKAEWYENYKLRTKDDIDIDWQYSSPSLLASANSVILLFETVSFLLTGIGLAFQMIFKD